MGSWGRRNLGMMKFQIPGLSAASQTTGILQGSKGQRGNLRILGIAR